MAKRATDERMWNCSVGRRLEESAHEDIAIYGIHVHMQTMLPNQRHLHEDTDIQRSAITSCRNVQVYSNYSRQSTGPKRRP